jgi:hypothetical protein
VWEDAADWPHVDADPLVLAVYVDGWPLQADVRACSWAYGISDPFAALSPSGASVTLDVPDAHVPTEGARLVLLTEGATLWYGYVQGVRETLTVDDAEPELVLTAADDLARAALVDWTGKVESQWLHTVLAMLAFARIAAVPVVMQSLADHWPGASFTYDAPPDANALQLWIAGDGLGSGQVTALVAQHADEVNVAVAMGPDGLRLWKRTLCLPFAASTPDHTPYASARSRSGDETRVVNDWWFAYPYGEDGTGRYRTDQASIDRYGLRHLEPANRIGPFPGPGWYLARWELAIPRLTEPYQLLDLAYPVGDHARYLGPFDAIEFEGDPVLVLQVSQAVTVDGWSVDVLGVIVDRLLEEEEEA